MAGIPVSFQTITQQAIIVDASLRNASGLLHFCCTRFRDIGMT